jgi:hypothetical protein
MSGCVAGRLSRTVVAFLVLATGCAKEGNSNDMPDRTGTAGASGSEPVKVPPEPTCVVGASCKCENGEIGETFCRADTASCDCAACPPFAPSVPTAFEPCGGAPEGTWLTRSYDLSGVVTYFGLLSPAVDATSIACPADFSELAGPDLRLVLKANGSAEVAYTAPDLYGTVLESCIEAGLARNCEQIPRCSSTGCGTCGCGLSKSDFSSDAASWSQKDDTLIVGPFTFDYCVKHQAMTIVNRDNGVRLELEQIVVPEQKCTGTPAECGLNKMEKDCGLVRGCSAATDCIGDAVRACDYLVDVCTLCPAGCECQFNVGQSQCSGVAHCEDMKTASDCAGLGCAWQGFVGCAGVPEPCESLSVADCRFTPGCTVK